MISLVIGGSASGKSEYAEKLVVDLGTFPRTYIATMKPYDEECINRIKEHQRMRFKKGFKTIECYNDLHTVKIEGRGTVLLECMSNLCANEFFKGHKMNCVPLIIDGIKSLASQCNDLIIVSNEVFSGGYNYEGETLEYLRALGKINCIIASFADNVCEVVAGIPVYHKGGA